MPHAFEWRVAFAPIRARRRQAWMHQASLRDYRVAAIWQGPESVAGQAQTDGCFMGFMAVCISRQTFRSRQLRECCSDVPPISLGLILYRPLSPALAALPNSPDPINKTEAAQRRKPKACFPQPMRLNYPLLLEAAASGPATPPSQLPQGHCGSGVAHPYTSPPNDDSHMPWLCYRQNCLISMQAGMCISSTRGGEGG
ncbi:hypothetical protein COCC4DRAFT_142898 [Bipolaris maydis ATCC 48331]|uniref:Uncharacterized protein n=2 Tax=Cochliobolus heterostrophus TaxID=5016 RepID=M2UIJ2_COCH5|nr:uncharacterized protein COCC4DRAFT_142898 [Bipolaris maydis ATCC 48331]EMD87808.1 hypothetical protein COCHEDRAFT_1033196 [Bipolaris maydis C5]ENI03322.1 hypothetical protein COCC4DRAFT_142898 [Bipolaris maydis ATCC 48331]